MKTIIFHETGLPVIVDPEKNDAIVFESDSQLINRYIFDAIYYIPEDCEIRYKNGKNTIVKKVNKNDIVLMFNKDFKNQIVVLKNEDLRQNIIQRHAEIESRRAKDTVLCEDKCCDCKCSY